MRSLLHWYLHGSRPFWASVTGFCYAVQGIARHFTGKWWLIPPWLMITLGTLAFAGGAARGITVWLDRRKPPPAPPAPGPRMFPAQLPPPGPAFIFRQPQ